VFGGVILVSGLIYLLAAVKRARPVMYVLKPGTMCLIIALAAGGVGSHPAPRFAWGVLLGLLASVCGDVCLMLSRERFLAGLASFLAAHLCYIAAISGVVSVRLGKADLAAALAVGTVGVLLFRRLAGGVRKREQHGLLLSVALYALVISVMLWRALTLLWTPGLPVYGVWVAAGAALFYLSDTLLAWDRFVRPLPYRDLWVMATYFAAQYGFAAAVAWVP
jgi:uncharacterized membrane protein YhhN